MTKGPKLPTWLAIAAMSLGLSATGCRRTPSYAEDKDTSNRPAPKFGNGSSAETPAPAGSGQAGSGQAAAGQAGSGQAPAPEAFKPGEVPSECNDYTAAMQKAGPRARRSRRHVTVRDALKQTYETTAKSWATMPPESKATMAKCVQGRRGIASRRRTPKLQVA